MGGGSANSVVGFPDQAPAVDEEPNGVVATPVCAAVSAASFDSRIFIDNFAANRRRRV